MKAETDYNVDYFIAKFEAIPELNWVSGFFGNHDKHCANGHCGVTDNNLYEELLEANALADILEMLDVTFSGNYHLKIFNVTAGINDGRISKYKQPTPKQRILAALYDIKASQKVEEVKPKIKEVIRYVSVPKTVISQAKQLVTKN